MSIAPAFLQESSTIRRSKMAKKMPMKKEENMKLSAKQKKLPPALQKAILKKKSSK